MPPSEAPTLPLIPVEQLRFQTGDDAGAPALPVAPSDSAAGLHVHTGASRGNPSADARTPYGDREAAPPAEQEAAPRGERQPSSGRRDVSAASSASASVPAVPRDLLDRREPLYRECQGYRLRLDPADLARLRELAGSRGRSDDEIGEAFFDGQADRLAESLAGDVPTPSEIRVIVDPYSRQAFLALENRIRGILSF